VEHTLTNLPMNPSGCPITRTLQAVEGRWATLIVRELLVHGPRRFGELRAALPGISPKTLTAQLRHLEAAGVLTRHAFAEVPPRVEYRPTARGRSLEPILLAMWEWGYDELTPDGPNPLRMPSGGPVAGDHSM
jgi:DNA-binding HxlR family transcriptional regulator